MKTPEPLVISWRGQQLRVRHDDPRLSPYSPNGATIRSAVELATDVEGLRLVLLTAVGDRYSVRVSDDGASSGRGAGRCSCEAVPGTPRLGGARVRARPPAPSGGR